MKRKKNKLKTLKCATIAVDQNEGKKFINVHFHLITRKGVMHCLGGQRFEKYKVGDIVTVQNLS